MWPHTLLLIGLTEFFKILYSFVIFCNFWRTDYRQTDRHTDRQTDRPTELRIKAPCRRLSLGKNWNWDFLHYDIDTKFTNIISNDYINHIYVSHKWTKASLYLMSNDNLTLAISGPNVICIWAVYHQNRGSIPVLEIQEQQENKLGHAQLRLELDIV